MTKSSKYHFDYIIVGNGLAGLQLALEFSKDSFFKEKSIALIDYSSKTKNDKTWCFWEKGNGKWDSIVHKSWTKNRFISPKLSLAQSLYPYKYKMVRSSDFYRFAKDELANNANFSFISDTIIDIADHGKNLEVIGQNNAYHCNYVFDSRVPTDYAHEKHSIRLIQHFKGYLIETKDDYFNVDEFVMMDYRLRYKETTSFTYVLPINTKKALVEFTFFSPELVPEKVYDKYLKEYINTYLNIDSYTIIESEQGQIPMTDYNFDRHNTPKITKIGTGGGWVKGSTGYSFKITEDKVDKIISNIKLNKTPSNGLFIKRFKFYDSIFLRVLYDYNNEGVKIFEKFYSKNKVTDYLAFLDERSTINQELKILASLFSPKFIISFLKHIIKI